MTEEKKDNSTLIEPQYDEYGGIFNTINDIKINEKNQKFSNKKGYNFFERLLLRYSKRANNCLDKNQKYKTRKNFSPNTIRIGPTNRCTARCAYCPREFIHKEGTGYMDFSLFEKLLDYGKKNDVKTVAFALFGEPLLHPRIMDMIRMSSENGFSIRLSTNAIILNKELADKILEYPIDGIEISMDGSNREEFLKGKQVDKYDQAKGNALYLIKSAKEKKVKTVLNIHFVDVGNVSLKNRMNFIKFWSNELKGLNFATSFCYEPHNWAGTKNDLRSKMNFIDRFLSKFELKKPCGYISGLNVNWNGDVYVCTGNPKENAIIGNINNQTIEDVYSSEKRERFLDSNERGSFSDIDCGICTMNSIFPLVFIKKRIINIFSRLF